MTETNVEEIRPIDRAVAVREKSVVTALFTGNKERHPIADSIQITPEWLSEEARNGWGGAEKGRSVGPSYRAPLQEHLAQVLVADALCVIVALAAAFLVWMALHADTVAGEWGRIASSKWTWVPMAIGVWSLAAWVTDMYDVAVINIKRVVAQRATVAVVISGLLVTIGYFMAPAWVPRTFLLLFLAFVGPTIIFARACLHTLVDRHPRPHHVLLLGSSEAERQLGDLFNKMFRLEYQIRARTNENTLAQIHFETDGNALAWMIDRFQIHEIVVSREIHDSEVFRALVDCQSSGTRISSMPEIYRRLSRRIPVEHVDPAWVIRALQDRILFSRIQLFVKRGIDLLGCVVAFPILAVLFPFVALAIKLDSKGPVFYRQKRSGRGGIPFFIVKFRTMREDAEVGGKAQWSADNDPRITKVGNFLRKTRIDELPQIFNVFKGEMTLVGPRPERPEFDEQLDKQLPHYFIRKLVKPGITGWAQVHYKYGNSVADSLVKLEYDAYYVRYWSIFLDFYTVARTIFVVLGGAGK